MPKAQLFPFLSPETMDINKLVIFYHGGCSDGFGSAYVAHHWLVKHSALSQQEALQCKIFASVYQKTNPVEVLREFDLLEPEKLAVLVVDFSFTKEQTEELAENCAYLGIIDHHAKDGVHQNIPDSEYLVFDNDECGMSLTWKTLAPDAPVPTLAQYVRDRDLWLHEKPHTHEVSAVVKATPEDLTAWAALHNEMESNAGFDAVLERGSLLLTVKAQQVEQLCSQVTLQNIEGAVVPVVNTQMHQSDVCHRLLEMFPDSPFSACYYDTNAGDRKFSVRSRSNEDFDVAALARRLGGGGHKHAAGFRAQGYNHLIAQLVQLDQALGVALKHLNERVSDIKHFTKAGQSGDKLMKLRKGRDRLVQVPLGYIKALDKRAENTLSFLVKGGAALEEEASAEEQAPIEEDVSAVQVEKPQLVLVSDLSQVDLPPAPGSNR